MSPKLFSDSRLEWDFPWLKFNNYKKKSHIKIKRNNFDILWLQKKIYAFICKTFKIVDDWIKYFYWCNNTWLNIYIKKF